MAPRNRDTSVSRKDAPMAPRDRDISVSRKNRDADRDSRGVKKNPGEGQTNDSFIKTSKKDESTRGTLQRAPFIL